MDVIGKENASHGCGSKQNMSTMDSKTVKYGQTMVALGTARPPSMPWS